MEAHDAHNLGHTFATNAFTRPDTKGFMLAPSQIFGAALGIILFCIMLSNEIEDEENQFEAANEMAAIVLLIASFWLFEVVPLEVAALFPVVFMPFLKVMSTRDVAKEYQSWIIMMMLGAFILDAAIIHVNLHKRVALSILTRVDMQQPWQLIAVFMFIAFMISSLCSNTATTVMLTPLAGSILETTKSLAELEEAQRRSPSEPHAAVGKAPLEVEESSCGGQPRVQAQPADLASFSTGVMLSICYGATCGGIATLLGSPVNTVLAGQDILRGQIDYANYLRFGVPVALTLVLVAFSVLYVLHGRSMRLQLNPAMIRTMYADLGPISRDEVAIASVQVLQVAGFLVRGFGWLPGFTGEFAGFIDDGSVACAAAVLPFLIPSVARPGEAIMTWAVAQKHVPWGVMLLLGAGLAIAKGFTVTNLTMLIGQWLQPFVTSATPLGFNYLLVAAVTFLTEITSNAATANVMMPILAAVATDTLTHPIQLMAPAAAACNFAFMTPVATPPNAVVFATGRVSFLDFVRSGFLVNVGSILLGGTVAFFMTDVVYGASAPFPKWACDNQPGQCVWFNESGLSEACDLFPGGAGVCRLKNGTIVAYL